MFYKNLDSKASDKNDLDSDELEKMTERSGRYKGLIWIQLIS